MSIIRGANHSKEATKQFNSLQISSFQIKNDNSERQEMLKQMKRLMKENTQLKKENMRLKQEQMIDKVQIQKLEIQLKCIGNHVSYYPSQICLEKVPLTMNRGHFSMKNQSPEFADLPTDENSREQITQITFEQPKLLNQSFKTMPEANKENDGGFINRRKHKSLKTQQIMAKYNPILECDDDIDLESIY